MDRLGITRQTLECKIVLDRLRNTVSIYVRRKNACGDNACAIARMQKARDLVCIFQGYSNICFTLSALPELPAIQIAFLAGWPILCAVG